MDRVTGPTEPSRPTIKRLFAVSGNCCAFPGCDCPLVDQASGSVIGEVCHIKGEKPDSARYDKAQTPKERHAFENLILLCGRHHKIIDDNEGEHTVERLMGMKARHEAGHQGDSVNERASKRFIANVTSKGPVVVSQGQRGGQTAFQITNVYPVAPATPPAFEVPLPPRHFVPRPEEIQALKNLVLDSLNRPVAITGTAAIGLRGMGGIGKSVLAACLAREQEIEKAFPDGVFWIVIGQTPAIESLQAQLVAQLGRPGSRLRRVMADKTCLLVLDDVWTADHAEAFRGLGPSVRLLLTTRDASLINVLGSREYSLDRLRDEQAIDLLGKWSGESPEQIAQNPAAVAVARECGNLPLALAVCGAMRLGPEPLAWKEIQTALEEADLDLAICGDSGRDEQHGSKVAPRGRRFPSAKRPGSCRTVSGTGGLPGRRSGSRSRSGGALASDGRFPPIGEPFPQGLRGRLCFRGRLVLPVFVFFLIKRDLAERIDQAHFLKLADRVQDGAVGDKGLGFPRPLVRGKPTLLPIMDFPQNCGLAGRHAVLSQEGRNIGPVAREPFVPRPSGGVGPFHHQEPPSLLFGRLVGGPSSVVECADQPVPPKCGQDIHHGLAIQSQAASDLRRLGGFGLLARAVHKVRVHGKFVPCRQTTSRGGVE